MMQKRIKSNKDLLTQIKMANEDIAHCSFCAKHKDSVYKLIVGHEVAICDECVTLCQDLLANVKKKNSKDLPKLDPRVIHQYLDQYVIGQQEAKMALSVAITNHFKRISRKDTNLQVQKSNVLMIGPTGTGKTLLAQTVAKYLDVPFVVADATTLTEAGYVGDDADSLIARLYQASGQDIERTQKGIVFLDEVDKIARKSEGATVSRDVSGEGVQQALLKLVEGTVCRVSTQGGRKISASDTVEIDTTNILFIVGGAFIGLDNIVRRRLQGTNIGFHSAITKTNDKDISPIADDLMRYGLIPEFVGRFPNVIMLHDLTKEHLISIMTGVKNNLVDQYRWLFDQDGVSLEFEDECLDLLAERSMIAKTGARGLKSEMEKVLMPYMYNLCAYKEKNIVKIVIDKQKINTPNQEQENT